MPGLADYDFAGVDFAARYARGDTRDWMEVGPDRCFVPRRHRRQGRPRGDADVDRRALLRDCATTGLALAHLSVFLYDELTDGREATDRGYGVHIACQILDEVPYEPATRGDHWRLAKRRRSEEVDGGR